MSTLNIQKTFVFGKKHPCVCKCCDLAEMICDLWPWVGAHGHIWFISEQEIFFRHVGLISFKETARDSDSHVLHLHRQWVTLLCRVKRRVIETSWQMHFVVFIYVKPVKWMRNVFPQHSPHVALGEFPPQVSNFWKTR